MTDVDPRAPMRANIELKARLEDRAAAEEVCRRLGARHEGRERQRDTYFSVGSYRMKLRESSEGRHWLIFYSRPDRFDARKSSYRLVPVPDPAEKRRIFGASMGIKVEVVKDRDLWLLDGVRIHLDRVEGLGEFLEFEAVVGDELPENAARDKVAELRREFGIRSEDLVSRSYSDLILGREEARR